MVVIDSGGGVIIVVGVVRAAVVADAVSVFGRVAVGVIAVGITVRGVPTFRGSWQAGSVGSFSLGGTLNKRQQGGSVGWVPGY